MRLKVSCIFILGDSMAERIPTYKELTSPKNQKKMAEAEYLRHTNSFNEVASPELGEQRWKKAFEAIGRIEGFRKHGVMADGRHILTGAIKISVLRRRVGLTLSFKPGDNEIHLRLTDPNGESNQGLTIKKDKIVDAFERPNAGMTSGDRRWMEAAKTFLINYRDRV